MVRSMTGFGFGEYSLYNRHITVQIKSVNSRYCEISIKLPNFISLYENDIKNIIKEEVSRGKVDVTITIDTTKANDKSVSIDTNLLDEYFEKLNIIRDKYDLEDEVSLKDLINFEGILNVSTNSLDKLEDIWETLFVALNNAIESFVETREIEGKSCALDISKKMGEFKAHLDTISLLSPIINQKYKQRLTTKITDLLADTEISLDNQRILTEVAIFADKTSIDEEIVRLYQTINAFNDTLQNESVVGRKLDFIIQELGREVNTISSKSQDKDLSFNCIAMKSILEKIREQVQNIE